MKRLRAESFVASFRVGAQEAEETALSRGVWKRRERDEKNGRGWRGERSNIEERGRETTTPLDTVKPRRKGEEETEAGLDGNGGRKGERGRVGLIGGGVNWES